MPLSPSSPPRLLFDFALYVSVRTLAAFVLGFPEFLLRGLIEAVASAGWIVDFRHRRRAVEHLLAAGYAPPLARSLGKQVFRHFLTSFLESLLLRRRLTPQTWRRYVRLENWDLLESAHAAGKGVLCVGCHQGNWELAGLVSSMTGLPLTTIARPFANPWLDRFLNASLRGSSGQQIVHQDGALRGLLRALKDGRIGVLLVDQNAGRDGVFVPFFGREASTSGSPAVLALRTGAPVLPFYTFREAPFRYVFGFHRETAAPPTGNAETDVRAITGWFTSLFERSIRERPDQWVWPHRRWKSRPGDDASQPEPANAAV